MACSARNECDIDAADLKCKSQTGSPLEKVVHFTLNSSPCSMNVAYLTKGGSKSVHRVMVADTNKGCAIFHSKLSSQNFCYFYLNLLKSQIAGTKSYLGSHITFGPSARDGKFSLHNTEYELLPGQGGFGKRRVCWYKFMGPSTPGMPGMHSTPVKEDRGAQCEQERILKMWKTIACGGFNGGTPMKRRRDGRDGRDSGSNEESPLAPVKRRSSDSIFFSKVLKHEHQHNFERFVNEFEPRTELGATTLLWEDEAYFCAIENALDGEDDTALEEGRSFSTGRVLNTNTNRFVEMQGRVGRSLFPS
jgi:hypothetical protein